MSVPDFLPGYEPSSELLAALRATGSRLLDEVVVDEAGVTWYSADCDELGFWAAVIDGILYTNPFEPRKLGP